MDKNGLFNGFTKEQLVANKPKVLVDALSMELARTNQALAAMSEEMRNIRDEVAKLRESTDYIAKKTDSPTMYEREAAREITL